MPVNDSMLKYINLKKNLQIPLSVYKHFIPEVQ